MEIQERRQKRHTNTVFRLLGPLLYVDWWHLRVASVAMLHGIEGCHYYHQPRIYAHTLWVFALQWPSSSSPHLLVGARSPRKWSMLAHSPLGERETVKQKVQIARRQKLPADIHRRGGVYWRSLISIMQLCIVSLFLLIIRSCNVNSSYIVFTSTSALRHSLT